MCVGFFFFEKSLIRVWRLKIKYYLCTRITRQTKSDSKKKVLKFLTNQNKCFTFVEEIKFIKILKD
jgi:hypothetical protein